ncbi:nuclear RNA export factor 1 [Protopterus annectens]|uniref:nuclear RNA export factor 1 n=1 Tax=Protopterus annectens TaxID=7888 RepID=UPI001CFAACEB|nr:nuclear RNA export factor 1 [Protopterus annectens]
MPEIKSIVGDKPRFAYRSCEALKQKICYKDFQVTYGKKYDREWLLESIKKCCSLPFTPIEYHFEENKAVFYVQDSNVANALKQVTRKITDKDNYRVKLLVHRSGAPLSVRNELKPEQLEVVKQCMSKRFNAAEQSLSLKNICSDPDLVAQKIDDVFFKRFCIYAVTKIIAEHIPELMSLDLSSNKLHYLDDVTDLLFGIRNLKILKLSQNELKYDRELDKLKGLKLDELWLDENPLCKTFADQAAYISNIRDRFPKLRRLDGHELPPPICFEIASETTLPTCKGSYFCTDDVKGLILHFLQQFYTFYDSDDRQGLLAAYHDNACFSVCTKSPPLNSTRALNDYLRENRNLKKVKDAALRFRLLRHKRLNIIAFLNELPKTEHDLKSFVVDVSVQTNTLLSFTVNGIFKEANDKAKDPVMAFSRVFVAVPAGSNGLCIVNDHLCVRSATSGEIRKAFVSPAPTPSSSPVPTLSATQQEMIQAFSLQSGMNFEWSQKCLNDNNWDYTKAAHVFTVLKWIFY